jgi:hypothetical protein
MTVYKLQLHSDPQDSPPAVGCLGIFREREDAETLQKLIEDNWDVFCATWNHDDNMFGKGQFYLTGSPYGSNCIEIEEWDLE